jgi:pectinesterase
MLSLSRARGSDSGLVTRAAFKAVRLRADPRSGRFDSYPLPPLGCTVGGALWPLVDLWEDMTEEWSYHALAWPDAKRAAPKTPEELVTRTWIPSRTALGISAFALAAASSTTAAAAVPFGWPAYASAVVAVDGSGQFRSLQAAIAAAPTASRQKPWIIYVKRGVYHERPYVQREKRFLALVGEDPETTIVSYDLNANIPGPDGKPIGTFRTPTAQIDADDFTAERLTFENAAGPVGQALAIRVDTVFVNRGRHYFEGCSISGHVDFIFGGATAFFERCAITVRGDGYITAASTPEQQPYGLVFRHCTIRGERPELRTYLGRPWRSFGHTVFLDTEMTEVVRPEGWHNWDRLDREKTVRYAEYGSSGAGAGAARRVPWARRLSAEEAAALTPARVLAGSDGWDPAAEGRAAAGVSSAGAFHPGPHLRDGRRPAAAARRLPAGGKGAVSGRAARPWRRLDVRRPQASRARSRLAPDARRIRLDRGRLSARAAGPLSCRGRGRSGGDPMDEARGRPASDRPGAAGARR